MIVILNRRFVPSENVDSHLAWLVSALVRQKKNNAKLFIQYIFKHLLFLQSLGKCSYYKYFMPSDLRHIRT